MLFLGVTDGSKCIGRDNSYSECATEVSLSQINDGLLWKNIDISSSVGEFSSIDYFSNR